MSAQSKLKTYEAARSKLLQQSTARQRLATLFDPDSFVEIDGLVSVNEGASGVVCGYGAVMGSPVYAFAQDPDAVGGAVGARHAAKIAKIYDLALKTGAPVVGVYDSAGARVAEGAAALNAYGELLLRINNLSGVVPQISLVVGTCAGTSAMLACSADFVVMSEGAEFFVTPPALAPDKTADAGTAKAAAAAGVAHIVEADEAAAIQSVRRMLAVLPLNNLAAPPVIDFAEPADTLLQNAGQDFDATPGADIAAAVCDANSAIELLATFGASSYTALATMGGTPCGIVATCGALNADDCAKIAKLVSVCDSFQIPVLSFVNAAGFVPSAQAELCGSVREMAKLAHVYAEATTAKVSVITGRAYGPAYVALASRAANSDYTVAWPTAVISALEPEAAVAFLYADRITPDNPREAVIEEYEANEASPVAAAHGGYIDDVIDPALTRPAVLSALDILSAKRVQTNPKKHANMPM